MIDEHVSGPDTEPPVWDVPQVAPELFHELHSIGWRHYGRLALFVVFYVVAASAAFQVAETSDLGGWVYLFNVPLYLLAAASLHGISLFTHEGVHGTLSANTAWNRFVSVVCALPVGQNFAAYKVLHLRHHRHLGQPGDPDHYKNYTSWTWLEFAMHWGRLIIGYPVYLVMIPILGFRQGQGAERWWIAFESIALIFLVVAVLWSPIPWAFLLHGWLIPMIVINTMVNIRGMSQHTFLKDAADPIRGTRSILTNPVTAFFMCNENYHLEHHLYPGVPWYNLPRLHRTLGQELRARGAPYIASYFAFVREFVLGSWRRSPWGRAKAQV